MLLDWIAREGGIVLSWWALVTAAGLAALPLCWRLLGALPDRGYTLARAAGVLLVAFTFWLLTTFGFLTNTAAGMALAWLIVAGVGGFALITGGRDGFDLRGWWKENRPVVIAGEIVFVVMLAGWAIVRAHQNGLVATEKPMELAFISSVMRSETFPPNDPWLSGYAISYYYFGYVMAAMLSVLSGVPSTVGFNMTISLLFALTGITVFGVVYNLVRGGAGRMLMRRAAQATQTLDGPSRRAGIIMGGVGVIFVCVLGSFQFPLIELPYQSQIASDAYLDFWNSNERMQPRQFGGTEPTGWDYWWWFRSARTINDVYPDGSREEVIDEFPQFSFVLADVHPHVLALPFAALALGLALNALLRGRDPHGGEIVFYALIIGGLIFLNTWDGPIYGILLIAAVALGRLMRGGGRLTAGDIGKTVGLGLVLFGLAVLFYLPFLIGFRSQLSGVLPNVLFPTLIQQFFAHFGALLVITVIYLLYEARRAGSAFNLRLGLQVAGAVVGLLVVMLLVLVLAGSLNPDIRSTVLGYVERFGGWETLLPTVLVTRVTHIFTALLLAAMLVLAVGRLFPRRLSALAAADPTPPTAVSGIGYAPATGFALLLIGAGIVLTLTPEFVYLRDFFGHRMNTVFKFYYQTWLLWGIAGAFATYSILADVEVPVRESLKTAFSIALAVCVTLGMLYPVLAIHNRMFVETGRWNGGTQTVLTLDGGSRFTHSDDVAAALCLADLVAASGERGDDLVVVEAVGGSYQGEYGRTATLTGIPVVYNWPFHQLQWRGNTLDAAAATREQDIDRLYADPAWEPTLEVIARYGIDFISFGIPEANRYGADAALKFAERLETVCQAGSSRYFRVPDALQTAALP